MTFQSSFQSHSQLGSNLHYISFWRGGKFHMYIAVSFPRGIWFPYGKSDSFVPLCSVEKTGLFLRIPTTLKDSEIMAISLLCAYYFSSFTESFYAQCLCIDFVLYYFTLKSSCVCVFMFLYCSCLQALKTVLLLAYCQS